MWSLQPNCKAAKQDEYVGVWSSIWWLHLVSGEPRSGEEVTEPGASGQILGKSPLDASRSFLALPVAHPTPNILFPSIEDGMGMGKQTVLFSWIKSVFLQGALWDLLLAGQQSQKATG